MERNLFLWVEWRHLNEIKRINIIAYPRIYLALNKDARCWFYKEKENNICSDKGKAINQISTKIEFLRIVSRSNQTYIALEKLYLHRKSTFHLQLHLHILPPALYIIEFKMIWLSKMNKVDQLRMMLVSTECKIIIILLISFHLLLFKFFSIICIPTTTTFTSKQSNICALMSYKQKLLKMKEIMNMLDWLLVSSMEWKGLFCWTDTFVVELYNFDD